MRCACGDVVLVSEDEKVTRLTGGCHAFNHCLETALERTERAPADTKVRRFKENLQNAAELVAVRDEQKSYRAGWDAGRRMADSRLAELKQDNSRLQALYQGMVTKHCGAGDEDEDDETEGDKLTIEKLRQSLADAHKKVSAYQKENAELKATGMRTVHVFPPAYMSDLNATKALLDKPYWAEGLDPDEP